MPAKWVTLVTAPNSILAENWAEMLRNNDMPAIARRDAEPSYLGTGLLPVRVMVPEEKLQASKDLLEEIIGLWESNED